MDKAFAKFTTETGKLAAQGGAGKTCTDADLIALGHLQTETFGARWAEAQGVGALQSAYEQTLQGAKDWVNMLITMGGTGTCATCAKLATPPCSETACKLAAASQASVDLAGQLTQPTIGVPGAVLSPCWASSRLHACCLSGRQMTSIAGTRPTPDTFPACTRGTTAPIFRQTVFQQKPRGSQPIAQQARKDTRP